MQPTIIVVIAVGDRGENMRCIFNAIQHTQTHRQTVTINYAVALYYAYRFNCFKYILLIKMFCKLMIMRI